MSHCNTLLLLKGASIHNLKKNETMIIEENTTIFVPETTPIIVHDNNTTSTEYLIFSDYGNYSKPTYTTVPSICLVAGTMYRKNGVLITTTQDEIIDIAGNFFDCKLSLLDCTHLFNPYDATWTTTKQDTFKDCKKISLNL